MAIPRPLPSFESAKRTLAHRLTAKADRIRQLATRFGMRPYRVFLTWTQWSGATRGEGEESILARVEILPTPRVSDLSGVTRQPRSTGVWPEGTVRVDQISAGAYSEDNLRGLVIPPDYAAEVPRGTDAPQAQVSKTVEPESDPRVDFFIEISEDGRGSPPAASPRPVRDRYRLYAKPWRSAGSLYWAIVVEASDDELDRDGQPRGDDLDVFEGADL